MNAFPFFLDCSRILFATWWLYVVILTSSYTGGLTAFMSSTENFLPVNNLKDMASRPNAKWIAPRGTALESFIKVIYFSLKQRSLHPPTKCFKFMLEGEQKKVDKNFTSYHKND